MEPVSLHPEFATKDLLKDSAAPKSARLESVDIARGLVMILMALDHVRHFFSDSLAVNATDLSQTDPALFLTRWITHFCAPTFVFLAGASAFLSSTRGKSIPELSRFLALRGLWLIFLELTFVRCLGWTFNFDYHFMLAGVLWALGWSMLALALLIHLPSWALTSVGLAIVVGHNLLDSLRPQAFGSWAWLWKCLHVSGQITLAQGVHIKIAYPILPWIGVMALGYRFGSLLQFPAELRRRYLLRIGFGLTLGFVLLRATNIYGDSRRWSSQATGLFTIFSFVNCTKYPPSLLFLLMTLGPCITALALFDKGAGGIGNALAIFGRVPLFFYLIHLPVIHGLAIVFSFCRYGDAHWLFLNPPVSRRTALPLPEGYGYSLPVVYSVWIAVVLLLLPVCAFARQKQERSYPILRFL